MRKDEKVIMEIHRHWMYFFWPVVTSLILIFPVIWLGYRILRYMNDYAVLTEERFESNTGILSVDSVSIRLDKIQSVFYHQDFLGRLVGYGDIQIQSGATYGMTTYSYTSNPGHIKQQIENAVQRCEEEKRKVEMAQQMAQMQQMAQVIQATQAQQIQQQPQQSQQ